jgi:serine/threonine protein phosphatase PrpC
LKQNVFLFLFFRFAFGMYHTAQTARAFCFFSPALESFTPPKIFLLFRNRHKSSSHRNHRLCCLYWGRRLKYCDTEDDMSRGDVTMVDHDVVTKRIALLMVSLAVAYLAGVMFGRRERMKREGRLTRTLSLSRYQVSHKKGLRVTQEDRHCVLHGDERYTDAVTQEVKSQEDTSVLLELPVSLVLPITWHMFAIYDGHGGKRAVEFVSSATTGLLARLYARLTFLESTKLTTPSVRACTESAFLEQDAALWEDLCEDRKTNCDRQSSGTTAMVIMMHVATKRVWSAHVGDSRALVFRCNVKGSKHESRNGKVVFETSDHKPLDEMMRIKRAGGFVTGRSPSRVNSVLAMSRALGDFHHGLKHNKNRQIDHRNAPVSALPTVSEINLDLDVDYTLLVACDGLWDVMSGDAVVKHYAAHEDTTCDSLTDHALALGSKDNVSALSICIRIS